MLTTLFLDVGGTIYIKNELGLGTLNPAILYLLDHIPKNIEICIISDTETFDVAELFKRDIPTLATKKIFTKKDYSWIKKNDPETYLSVCRLLNKEPSSCALIDNQEDFRSAAEQAGFITFGVSQNEILRCLGNL